MRKSYDLLSPPYAHGKTKPAAFIGSSFSLPKESKHAPSPFSVSDSDTCRIKACPISFLGL